MVQVVFDFLRTLSTFATLIPVELGFLVYPRLSAFGKRILVIAVLSATSNVASFILADLKEQNYFIFHIYAPLVAMLWGFTYARIFEKRSYRLISKLGGVAILIYGFIHTFYLSEIDQFPQELTIVLCIWLILLSILGFLELITQPKAIPLEKSPLFWVSAGNLLYFVTSLLVMLFFSKILALGGDEMWSVLSVSPIINLIWVAMICKSMWIQWKMD